MEIPLLRDIVTIFGLSILVLLACHKLRIPSLVGFLITGIICGPEGFGLVRAVEEVKVLAEIGIVILLFTVGLEFSVKKLLKIFVYFYSQDLCKSELQQFVVLSQASFWEDP